MFIRIIKILYYDRINVSKGTDVNKTSASKECDIYHYWYLSYWHYWYLNQMSAIDVMIY